MSTNIRSNFPDFFGTTKLPELEAIVQSKSESYPSMIPILFNEESMTTDIYQTTTMSGLRNPEVKPENVPIKFQSMKPGFSKTYQAVEFGTGYRISKQAVDDGKFSFIQRATLSFAKGMFEICELDAASVFDGAFATNGYDGVPLCSTSHPLENGNGILGANRPVTFSELSITSFRELRNVLQDTLNEDGQRVRYSPSYFVVGQGLQDVAAEIVKSQYNPENANNAINTVYNSVQLLPGGFWNYLASDTAFFMVTEKMDHNLMFLTRTQMETDSDYDKKAKAWELMATKRYDKGYSNWRGVVGNAGA